MPPSAQLQFQDNTIARRKVGDWIYKEIEGRTTLRPYRNLMEEQTTKRSLQIAIDKKSQRKLAFWQWTQKVCPELLTSQLQEEWVMASIQTKCLREIKWRAKKCKGRDKARSSSKNKWFSKNLKKKNSLRKSRGLKLLWKERAKKMKRVILLLSNSSNCRRKKW